MVLRREDSVLGARFGKKPCPLIWVVVRGREVLGLGHVLLVADLSVEEGPALGPISSGVDAPMDENAELCVEKPGLNFSGHATTLPKEAGGLHSVFLC